MNARNKSLAGLSRIAVLTSSDQRGASSSQPTPMASTRAAGRAPMSRNSAIRAIAFLHVVILIPACAGSGRDKSSSDSAYMTAGETSFPAGQGVTTPGKRVLPPPPATETACHTDGCVLRKQAEFQAVVNWMETNDECESVVVWPQAIKTLSETDFSVTCGDTSDRKIFTVRIDN